MNGCYGKNHEQVEQVGRQEGAVETHQLDLEQRMEMHADPVPVGHGKDDGGRGHHPGEQQHRRREPVEHQHDAERHLPVGRQVDAERADRGRRLARRGRRHPVVHRPGQHDGQQQPDHAGADVEPGQRLTLLVAQVAATLILQTDHNLAYLRVPSDGNDKRTLIIRQHNTLWRAFKYKRHRNMEL